MTRSRKSWSRARREKCARSRMASLNTCAHLPCRGKASSNPTQHCRGCAQLHGDEAQELGRSRIKKNKIKKVFIWSSSSFFFSSFKEWCKESGYVSLFILYTLVNPVYSKEHTLTTAYSIQCNSVWTEKAPDMTVHPSHNCLTEATPPLAELTGTETLSTVYITEFA